MRHVTQEGLDQLEPLLNSLRECEPLQEKKRGVFYFKSRAFLHFHEDPAGYFADVRLEAEFERVRVTTKAEQRRLISSVRKALIEKLPHRKGE